MSFNEAACCFDASMYIGTPDTAPCAQSLDTKSIIAGLDKLLFSGDDAAASEYLDRWCKTAQEVGDWRTELTLQSELMGFHRRTSDKNAAMAAVERGLELIREHRLGSTVSGATIFLNAATTLKAYGMAERSIPMFVQTCRVYSQTLDPLDYRFGGLYNNMALSYADIGEYDTAEGYYKKALGVIVHCDTPQNELAVTYCNLAELYERMGREADIAKALNLALDNLRSPALPHDGYYDFTVSKCLPTFEHFGYKL